MEGERGGIDLDHATFAAAAVISEAGSSFPAFGATPSQNWSNTRWNAACEGSIISDDGENWSQGCTRDCPVDPDGTVPRCTQSR